MGSESTEDLGILSSTKLYIVIACIVALLFIALVQATCTIYRITRKPAQPTATKVPLMACLVKTIVKLCFIVVISGWGGIIEKKHSIKNYELQLSIVIAKVQ